MDGSKQRRRSSSSTMIGSSRRRSSATDGSGQRGSSGMEGSSRRKSQQRGSIKEDHDNTIRKKAPKRHSNATEQTYQSSNSDFGGGLSTSDFGGFDDSIVLTKKSAVPADCPEELKVVRSFIRYKDRHDLRKMKQLTSDDCYFLFIDADTEMPASEFYEAMEEIYASFPDLRFNWKTMSIQEVYGPESRHPGTAIVIEDYYGVGRHTGKPYKFGPYPEVEPIGKKVRDENIEFTFIVNEEGKINHATIYAFGKVVGPPGFYSKIGGIIM